MAKICEKRKTRKPIKKKRNKKSIIKNDFICDQCSSLFSSRFSLNRHINSIHLKKKFLCNHCGLEFSRIKDHYKCCQKLIMKVNNEFLSNLRIDNFGNIDYFINDNNINNQATKPKHNNKISKNFPNKKNSEKIDEFLYFKNNVIGKGGYSFVYFGYNTNTGSEVAVKEYSALANPIRLKNEIKVLKKLKNNPYFPTIYKYDKNERKIIESLMGPTLKKLFLWCGNIFPEKTVANIGIEVLKRLKELHNKGIIHRDLKPENLCWGNFSSNENSDKMSIILIDYGLSDFYLNKEGKHINFKTDIKYVGIFEFSSINSINFNQQSRKDDLESLMLILIFFLKGKLPWSGSTTINEKNELEYYKNIKNSYTIDKLCSGLSREFSFIFESIRNLKFASEPDYDIYINILEKFIEKNVNKFEEGEYKFIWEKKLFEIYSYSIRAHEFGLLTFAKNFLFPGFPVSIYEYISSLKKDILYKFNIKSIILN